MKKIFKLFSVLFVVGLLGGCASETETERNVLRNEINEMQITKSTLESTIASMNSAKDYERYIIVCEIGQTHYSLDLEDMMKDSMNRIELTFPVDKAFYDYVEVGDVLDDSFRMGSYFTSGSIGSWDISIVDKYIE